MRVLKFGGTSVADAERIGVVSSIVQCVSRQERVVVVVSALAGVTDALQAAIHQALSAGGAQSAGGARSAGRASSGGARSAGGASSGASSTLDADLRHRHLRCASMISEADVERYRHLVDGQLEKLRRWLEGITLLGEVTSGARDRILAVGERLATPLVALALNRQGIQTRTYDGSSLIVTGPSGTLGVDFAATRQRVAEEMADLAIGEVGVVTGFIAGDTEGRTTTLGRGASDFSATLLGAALEADEVEIWTDVDGVLSAEPRLVPQAISIPHLTYGEASDLACLGARVLHPQTLEPLASRGIPLRIRNTLHPERAGTRVGSASPSTAQVRVVTALSRVVRLRFHLRRRQAGAAGQKTALRTIERLESSPLLLAWETPGQTLSAVIPEAEESSILHALEGSLDSQAIRRDELALVAVVDGSGALFSTTAPKVLGALAEQAIQVRGLIQPAAAPRTLGVLVDRSALCTAVRLLHQRCIVDPGPSGRASSLPMDAVKSVPQGDAASF